MLPTVLTPSADPVLEGKQNNIPMCRQSSSLSFFFFSSLKTLLWLAPQCNWMQANTFPRLLSSYESWFLPVSQTEFPTHSQWCAKIQPHQPLRYSSNTQHFFPSQELGIFLVAWKTSFQIFKCLCSPELSTLHIHPLHYSVGLLPSTYWYLKLSYSFLWFCLIVIISPYQNISP